MTVCWRNETLLVQWFIVLVFVAMQSTEKSPLCKAPKSDRTLQNKCNLYWVCRLSHALRIFFCLFSLEFNQDYKSITNPNLLRQEQGGLWISFFPREEFLPMENKEKPANICQESWGNPTHPREMSPKLGSMNQGKQKNDGELSSYK